MIRTHAGESKVRCTMTRADRAIDVERVPCEVCRKEVPKSESVVPEAADYLIHFCGLDCFDKWKQQRSESPSRK